MFEDNLTLSNCLQYLNNSPLKEVTLVLLKSISFKFVSLNAPLSISFKELGKTILLKEVKEAKHSL